MDANLIGVLAGTIALIGSCSGGDPDVEASSSVPIDTRAVAAQALTHLPTGRLGTARGQEDRSESGREQAHLVVWSLAGQADLMVAVSREDPTEPDDFVATCASVREDAAVLSCRAVTVQGRKVLVMSSSEDVTGGRYENGITWAAVSARGPHESVAAVLMIPDLSGEAGWRTGEGLPVSLEQLAAIAGDPLLDMKTSPEVIANGSRLEDFEAAS